MVLSAGKVQGVGCVDAKSCAELSRLQINYLGHFKRCELSEEVGISPL